MGKSTLMNRILRTKVSIVSYKPQTTRHRILGICHGESYQAVFLDTPGLIEPKNPLQESMVRTAQKAVQEADIILMMVEAGKPHPDDDRIFALIGTLAIPKFLLINKIDKMAKSELLPQIDGYSRKGLFQEIIPLSALTGDGVDALVSLISRSLPPGEPLYDPELISDEPERFFAAELIREQIYLGFNMEIPYSTAVQIVRFEEKEQGKDYIEAVITVERDSQKAILIGKKGDVIKKIGTRARINIERFLGRPVYLDLRVQVRKKWLKDPEQIKRFGY